MGMLKVFAMVALVAIVLLSLALLANAEASSPTNPTLAPDSNNEEDGSDSATTVEVRKGNGHRDRASAATEAPTAVTEDAAASDTDAPSPPTHEVEKRLPSETGDARGVGRTPPKRDADATEQHAAPTVEAVSSTDDESDTAASADEGHTNENEMEHEKEEKWGGKVKETHAPTPAPTTPAPATAHGGHHGKERDNRSKTHAPHSEKEKGGAKKKAAHDADTRGKEHQHSSESSANATAHKASDSKAAQRGKTNGTGKGGKASGNAAPEKVTPSSDGDHHGFFSGLWASLTGKGGSRQASTMSPRERWASLVFGIVVFGGVALLAVWLLFRALRRAVQRRRKGADDDDTAPVDVTSDAAALPTTNNHQRQRILERVRLASGGTTSYGATT